MINTQIIKITTAIVITLAVVFSCKATSKKSHKIMSYNVHICRGNDEVYDYDRVANIIKNVDADIIALQELDSATVRSSQKVTGQELANRLNMHFTFGASINYSGGKYGIGILSKETPINVSQHSMPGKAEARTMLIAEFKEYYFAATHLSLTEQERVESMNKILNLTSPLKSKPIILAGDFNATPDAESIKLISSNFTFLSDTTQQTFPAEFPDRTIDYIMGSNSHKYTIIKQEVIPEKTASDHRPIFIELKIKQ